MSEMTGNSEPSTPVVSTSAAVTTPSRSQDEDRSLRECEDYVQRHRIQQVTCQTNLKSQNNLIPHPQETLL